MPGASAVTVLSHNFWERQLGGDPAVVGQTLTLNGHAFTVVGVAPRGFKGANAIADARPVGADGWRTRSSRPAS